MAMSMTPSEMSLSRSIKTQLTVAARHLESIYTETVNDLNRDRLRQITRDSHVNDLVSDMTKLVGHSVSNDNIKTECVYLAEHPFYRAQDHLVCYSPKATSVRGRLSNLFVTPIKAIKLRLQKSSQKPGLTKSDSTNSLGESSPSQHGRVPPSQDKWDCIIGDNTLAQVSSQLDSLPKKEVFETADVTQDSTTIQLSPSPEKNQDNKRRNRRRTCTGMRTRTQTASNRRRSMTTSANKKHMHKKHTSPYALFEPEMDVIPETLESNIKKVDVIPKTQETNIKEGRKGKGKKKQQKEQQPGEHCLQEGCHKNRQSDSDMVQCSHCGTWHHLACVGLNKSDVIGVWPCPRCSQRTDILTECHQMLVEVRSQVMALQLLQEGVDDKLKLLQKNKNLEKSNLDLVRLLASKTAQCEALSKKNTELTKGEQQTKSPQQPAKERKANKDTLIVGSYSSYINFWRHYRRRSRNMSQHISFIQSCSSSSWRE